MTNRHERRKAGKTMRMERVEMTVDQLQAAGGLCAWDGCWETFTGELPNGWRHILLFWSPKPVQRITDIPPDTWDRDAVLCPAHGKQVDRLMKPLGRALDGPPAGSA